ncbi:Crp/Fnr family transcriptional regulator [Chitinophaga japonensis]|uniref:CRP/FNR family transcriptional regulator n=1 Tax=Chitinophaga japonensis TaxID=104662 RepID=A0A562SSY6_CHIJA|nr:Crp/Fnr family transcriptional regulator [Chitinophaga japonensis]TWI84218.1 CRP/FNR family transcriptional regulator [Chitinophaga japonensis]
METAVQYWHLRRHRLFSKLSAADIKELCILSGYKKAAKDEVIYISDHVRRIYVLKKGVIRISTIDAAGNEVLKDVVQEGDLFGEITLSPGHNGQQGPEIARAVSQEVSLCSFLLQDFEKLLLRKPGLSLEYTRWIGMKLTRMHTRYADLVCKDARTRLIEFLKGFSIQRGKVKGREVRIRNYLTQKDIAGIIGATRQTVATLIGELEQQGLLRYSRSEIIIPDMALFQ